MRIQDGFERQAVLKIVQAMDSEYVAHQVKKMQGGRGPASNDTGHPKSA